MEAAVVLNTRCIYISTPPSDQVAQQVRTSGHSPSPAKYNDWVACCLLPVDLHLDPEDGGICLSETSIKSYRTVWSRVRTSKIERKPKRGTAPKMLMMLDV
jgi:hypothetical protein